MQFAVGIVISILGMVLSMIHVDWMGSLLVFGLRLVLFLVFIVFWIIAGFKAHGGQWYKLPLIGELAWKTVNQ